LDLHITPAGRDSSEGAIKETGLLAGQPSAILRCGHVDREEDARDNGDERREHDVRRIRKNKEKKAKGKGAMRVRFVRLPFLLKEVIMMTNTIGQFGELVGFLALFDSDPGAGILDETSWYMCRA
jgi:hypothetical protein